jgi:hypothetical protein
MFSKQESLRERVYAFWKMHRRENKSFTVNHFVAEEFFGYYGLQKSLLNFAQNLHKL